MHILIYIIAYSISVTVSVAILAGSLFLVEDRRASSFKEFGTGAALGRCAAIVIVTTLVGFIPFGFLLALVVWFLGIMFLFQKTFGQTLILWLVNVVFSFGVVGALAYILARVL